MTLINHTRTLLLNLPGNYNIPGYLGEEIIEPAFRSLELPPVLKLVDRCLFPENASRETKNYLVRHYLALLDASQSMPEFDTRRTYDLRVSDFSSPELYVPLISSFGTEASLTVLNPGERSSNDHTFRLSWDIVVTSGPQMVIENHDTTIVVTDVESGSFVPTRLPGSPLLVSARATVGARWRVKTYATPSDPIPRLEAKLRALPAAVVAEVFQRATPLRSTEPYTSAYELWSQSKYELKATAAFLLAYVHRLEAIRLV